jgi:hypothetical protein
MSPSRSELPPPSPALLARVGALRPVRPRRPAREAAAVALASLGLVAAMLLVRFPPRADLMRADTLLAATACALGFAAALWWALVPPRGQVLPLRPSTPRRLAAAALLALAALAAAGRDFTAGASFAHAARACFAIGLLVSLLPAALCLGLLRRALAEGGWRFGLAVGAAAGALGGLTLTLHCGNRHLAHVLVAHGGALVAPALLLAAALAAWQRAS